MAMNLNLCVFVGRLTRDPELRYTAANRIPVAHFSLAVGRGSQKDGQEETDFFSCTAYDKQAEFAERFLRKGVRIVVTGRMKNNSYTDKNGNKVFGMELSVKTIDFADGWTEPREDIGRESPVQQSSLQAQKNSAQKGTQKGGSRTAVGNIGARSAAGTAARSTNTVDGFMNIPDEAENGFPFN